MRLITLAAGLSLTVPALAWPVPEPPGSGSPPTRACKALAPVLGGVAHVLSTSDGSWWLGLGPDGRAALLPGCELMARRGQFEMLVMITTLPSSADARRAVLLFPLGGSGHYDEGALPQCACPGDLCLDSPPDTLLLQHDRLFLLVSVRKPDPGDPGSDLVATANAATELAAAVVHRYEDLKAEVATIAQPPHLGPPPGATERGEITPVVLRPDEVAGMSLREEGVASWSCGLTEGPEQPSDLAFVQRFVGGPEGFDELELVYRLNPDNESARAQTNGPGAPRVGFLPFREVVKDGIFADYRDRCPADECRLSVATEMILLARSGRLTFMVSRFAYRRTPERLLDAFGQLMQVATLVVQRFHHVEATGGVPGDAGR
jgi:hypothetical protein